MAPRALLAAASALAAAFLASGCGGDDTDDRSSSKSTSESSASASSTTEVPTTDETEAGPVVTSDSVDIGGRSMFYQCWGTPVDGEPTVLLVSGQGPTLGYWDPMATEFAAEGHHLCAYDRAGVGTSEVPQEGRRTTRDQVTDLVAMLDAAQLAGPFVVVAHSLGSLPAISFAAEAPDRVAGIVLIDPWTPRVNQKLLAALPPAKPNESAALAEERQFVTDFPRDPTQNSEHLLVAASDEEVIALLDQPGGLFGDRPVIVLQAPFPERPAGLPRDYDAAARAAWTSGNAELAGESTRGKVIKVEDTGHNIHEDQPGVVMDAIRDVLAR